MKNPNMVWEKSTPPSQNASFEHPGESFKIQEKSCASQKPHAADDNVVKKPDVFGKRQRIVDDVSMENSNVEAEWVLRSSPTGCLPSGRRLRLLSWRSPTIIQSG